MNGVLVPPPQMPITVAGLSLDDLASLSLIALVALTFYDRFWGRRAR